MRSPFHGWLLNLYLTLALVLLAFPGCSLAPRSATVPNILLILTDDLGYGDVSAYNDQARVTTRNLDALAAEGMRFIDAHSPSTVCTPTRYSILTGQMAFRTGMTGVFTGVEGPCLINQDTLTLPQMLQDSGYTTALFGKWHLGMSFFTPDGLARWQPRHFQHRYDWCFYWCRGALFDQSGHADTSADAAGFRIHNSTVRKVALGHELLYTRRTAC